MPRLLSVSLAPILALLSVSVPIAQNTGPVQGVWKLAEVTAEDGKLVTAQPGLLIFTKQHYSMVVIRGAEPRTLAQPQDLAHPTDREKLAMYAHWSRVGANSGAYDVRGNEIHFRAIVAKNDYVISRPARIVKFRLDGNTLWLMDSVSLGPRTKLTRLE